MDQRRRQIAKLQERLEAVDERFAQRELKLKLQHKSARDDIARRHRRLVADIRHEELSRVIDEGLSEFVRRLHAGLNVFAPAADEQGRITVAAAELPFAGMCVPQLHTQLWASVPGGGEHDYVLHFLWTATALQGSTSNISHRTREGRSFLKLRFDRRHAPPSPRSLALALERVLAEVRAWPRTKPLDFRIAYDPEQDIIDYWMKPDRWYGQWLDTHLRHWGSSELHPYHPSKERMSAYWVQPTRNWRMDLVELRADRANEGGLTSDQLWLMPFGIGDQHVVPALLGEVFDPPADRHSAQWANEMLEACMISTPW